jgi:membrane fusion protein (multidrug efflux system)
MGGKFLFIKRLWRTKKPEIFCGFICLLAVIGLITILVRKHLYVLSDYAVLQAYFIPLAPQVSGEITQVNVIENQAVTRGQVLCSIDDRPYRNAEREAENERDALLAQWQSAELDWRRASYFLKHGSIARAQGDAALASARSLRAQYQAAEARASIAKLNVARTHVLAPSDGFISFRTAQPGMYASTKTPLFGFIASQTRWVEAKIRETDLPGIRVGDSAQLSFDSIPGRKFSGVLESIGQATETPFAAIPDDFSAGNFSKYPQWLPVRIRLNLNGERLSVPIGVNVDVRMNRRRG